jgi:hypothetical protein
VPKDAVGRSALFQLLRSNLDMFPVCVDRCYYRDMRIATASFQVNDREAALRREFQGVQLFYGLACDLFLVHWLVAGSYTL